LKPSSLIIVFLALQAVVTAAQQPTTAFNYLQSSGNMAWMKTDPELRTPVTVDLDGVPMYKAFAALTHKTGVALRTEVGLQEYRICLHTRATPLAHIMGRLQDLFGHGTLPNRGYEWVRSTEGGKNSYSLFRNGRGRQEEADALNSPTQKLVPWLRQIRDYVALPPDKRKLYKSDCPILSFYIKRGASMTENCPSVEAIAALTDAQIDELVANRQVAVPQLKLSDAALAYLKQVVPSDIGIAPINTSNSQGPTVLNLEQEQNSQLRGVFAVKMSAPWCPLSITLDTMRQLPIQYADEISTQKAGEGPQIDLFAHADSVASRSHLCSLSQALSLLAQEAGITLYAETFPKPEQNLLGTKGNLESLLAMICRNFACEWRKDGDDYLVYSKSWAQDRAADIPQATLDRWRANYTGQHRYDVSSLIDMACLTEEQQATVIDLLKVQSPFIRRNRNALQLLTTLSAPDLEQAFTPAGVDIDTLDDDHLRMAQALFGRQVIAPLYIHINYTQRAQNGSSPSFVDIECNDQVGAAQTCTVRDYSEPSPDRRQPQH
jgi:hypothetical protein